MTTKTKNEKIPPKWLKSALEAMSIAFDNDSGLIKPLLTEDTKQRAISLFRHSIDNLEADEAWPFIKMADLLDDPNDKMRLYIRSLKFEYSIYAIKFILSKILQDHPDIIDKYL